MAAADDNDEIKYMMVLVYSHVGLLAGVAVVVPERAGRGADVVRRAGHARHEEESRRLRWLVSGRREQFSMVVICTPWPGSVHNQTLDQKLAGWLLSASFLVTERFSGIKS